MTTTLNKLASNEWFLLHTDSDASGTPATILTPAATETIQIVDIVVTTTATSPVLLKIGSRPASGPPITDRIKVYIEENAPFVPNMRIPLTFEAGDKLTIRTSAASVIACHFGGKYI